MVLAAGVQGVVEEKKYNSWIQKYYNFATENNDAIYDKDRVLNSGYTVGQGCGCLDKAWVGFRNAKRLENYCDINYTQVSSKEFKKNLELR